MFSDSISECEEGYSGHGVTFRYPGFWEIQEESDDGDIVITVSADDSCFWLLRILSECPRPDEVVQSCLSALSSDLDDEQAEVTEFQGKLADMPAVCREVSFSCLELLNTAGFRCVRTLQMTLLVWWQCTDHELTEIRSVFDQMTQSVRIEALESAAVE